MFKREESGGKHRWRYIAKKHEFKGADGQCVPSHHLMEIVHYGGAYELHRIHATGKLPTVKEVMDQIDNIDVDSIDMIFDLGLESGRNCKFC